MIVLEKDYNNLLEILEEFSINTKKSNVILKQLEKKAKLISSNEDGPLRYTSMTNVQFYKILKEKAKSIFLDACTDSEALENIDYDFHLNEPDFLIGCFFLLDGKKFTNYISSSIEKISFKQKGTLNLVGCNNLHNFPFIGFINETSCGHKVFSILYLLDDKVQYYIPKKGNSSIENKFSNKYDIDFELILEDLVSTFFSNAISIDKAFFISKIEEMIPLIEDEDALMVIGAIKEKYLKKEEN